MLYNRVNEERGIKMKAIEQVYAEAEELVRNKQVKLGGKEQFKLFATGDGGKTTQLIAKSGLSFSVKNAHWVLFMDKRGINIVDPRTHLAILFMPKTIAKALFDEAITRFYNTEAKRIAKQFICSKFLLAFCYLKIMGDYGSLEKLHADCLIKQAEFQQKVK